MDLASPLARLQIAIAARKPFAVIREILRELPVWTLEAILAAALTAAGGKNTPLFTYFGRIAAEHLPSPRRADVLDMLKEAAIVAARCECFAVLDACASLQEGEARRVVVNAAAFTAVSCGSRAALAWCAPHLGGWEPGAVLGLMHQAAVNGHSFMLDPLLPFAGDGAPTALLESFLPLADNGVDDFDVGSAISWCLCNGGACPETAKFVFPEEVYFPQVHHALLYLYNLSTLPPGEQAANVGRLLEACRRRREEEAGNAASFVFAD